MAYTYSHIENPKMIVYCLLLYDRGPLTCNRIATIIFLVFSLIVPKISYYYDIPNNFYTYIRLYT